MGSGETEVAAEAAAGRPLDAAQLQKAVGLHLGGEAALAAASWDLAACDLEAGLFVPGGAIKEARRRAVAALLAAQRSTACATAEGLQQGDVLAGMLAEIRATDSSRADQATAAPAATAAAESEAAGEGQVAGADEPSTSGRTDRAAGPVLRVLCRSKAQVDAALALPWLQEIVLDFLEVGRRARGGVFWLGLPPAATCTDWVQIWCKRGYGMSSRRSCQMQQRFCACLPPRCTA